MKKKVIAGLLLSSCVLGVAMPAFAETKPVDGEGTTDIQVNGTLGVDNTKPDAEIPEGEEGWINVTVPTTTVFYNTTTVKAIKSPTYEIVNNSGRPVDVSISTFTPGANTGMDLSSLDLSVTIGSTDTPVVSGGDVVDFSTTPGLLAELANSEGHREKGDAGSKASTATFRYTGTANATTQVQPKYTMTLKFDAVAWN